MKDNPNKKVKNKTALITGIIIGLLTVLFLNRFFQGLMAYMAGAADVEFGFAGIWFTCYFNIMEGLSTFIYILIYTAPLLFIVIMLGIGNLILKKSSLGLTRYSVIVFFLVNVGYIIINVFYGTFSVVLQTNAGNDWYRLFQFLGFSGNQGIALIFFVIVSLIIYVNISTKRLIKYISG